MVVAAGAVKKSYDLGVERSTRIYLITTVA